MPVRQKRKPSIVDVKAQHAMNGTSSHHLASPLNPNVYDPNDNYDFASRSTSAYSAMVDAAAPLMFRAPGQLLHTPSVYPEVHANGSAKSEVTVRIPSDQLQMVLDVLSPKQSHQNVKPAATMPPPPLPSFAAAAKVDGSAHGGHFGEPLAPNPQHPPFARDVIDFYDRRQSRQSDVSMHAGCNSFPACTTEDGEGHIIHSDANNPATVVRGRKEGSSPTKRKLSRNPSKSDHAEKKTRRSSRLLQHHPRANYDDGASGSSANGHSNADGDDELDGTSGTGDDVVPVEQSR